MSIKPKVRPLAGRSGKSVANQYVIVLPHGTYFQSYDKVIAWKSQSGTIVLDREHYNYSRTTMKYLCQFLGIDAATLHQNVKAGKYGMGNLN